MLGLEIMLVLDIGLELSIYPQLITLWIVAENLSCWGLSDVSCKVVCREGLGCRMYNLKSVFFIQNFNLGNFQIKMKLPMWTNLTSK